MTKWVLTVDLIHTLQIFMVVTLNFERGLEVLRIFFLHSHSFRERFPFLSQCPWLSVKVHRKWTVKSVTH